jgi:hypothetical protein
LVESDVLLDANDSTLGFGSSSRHLFLDSVLLQYNNIGCSPSTRHSTRIRSLARPSILHSASFSILVILQVTILGWILHISSCFKALCASKIGRSTVFELQFELNRQLRLKVYSIVKRDFEIALMRALLIWCEVNMLSKHCHI